MVQVQMNTLVGPPGRVWDPPRAFATPRARLGPPGRVCDPRARLAHVWDPLRAFVTDTLVKSLGETL